ncbi:MAG: hypothetical protein H6745_22405 [Deltaproteobacteria bacterium]|nr:hypothetical protein [Deltaproteobacteria bacterium]
MDPTRYDAFTAALLASLTADERVLGVVAAGSMAARGRAPDAWSDHDLWIVACPGAQEPLRAWQGWLPDAHRHALVLRETAHGVKVLYDDGHLVEYAVFDPDELAVARVNDYRVLLDRERVAERLADVRARTEREAAVAHVDVAWHLGQLITNVVVGAGRWARGERLSAHRFVLEHALGHLVTLIVALVPPEDAGAVDDLDGARRFERARGALGARVAAATTRGALAGAEALLDVAVDALADRIDGFPHAAVAAARAVVARAAAAAS